MAWASPPEPENAPVARISGNAGIIEKFHFQLVSSFKLRAYITNKFNEIPTAYVLTYKN